jgi:hypothetical protein
MTDKFEFPRRGFYTVEKKVKEADFFLDKFKDSIESLCYDESDCYFSAFVSAARSITFALQSAMSKYPGFKEWYPARQERLRDSGLAKLFVTLRNHSQKIGDLPLSYGGFSTSNERESFAFFQPNKDFPLLPNEDVVTIATNYLITILEVIHECYQEYRHYVNPDIIFTSQGLEELGWSIEDLEESLGFPRGWTDIPDWDDDKDENRLHCLRREGAPEEMSYFFNKYNIYEKYK